MSLVTPDEARLLQPAVLAFIGDAVFNLFIRERLIINQKGTSHKLHILSTEYVKAASQSKISKALMDTFTAEEAYIFRRGRNTKSTTIPKNADVQDYKYATAFEALLGYLYLTQQRERLNQLMEQAANIIEAPRMEIKNEKE
ncbi:MAG: Mini-ribonuclease 3 [Acetivibrionales bacterium]